MHTGKLIFNQLLRPLHHNAFRRIAARYDGDYRLRTFSCWDQFLCLAFGQLTFRESLRDLPADFIYTIVEGQGVAGKTPLPAP